MARHGVTFKNRALARLLAPESASMEVVAQQIGVRTGTLARWRDEALSEPAAARASPQQTQHDRRRIKELERELLRKERALAETAALLVLSKKSR